jgi:pyruvate ferredoxin oxidoreductase gamma subunit
VPSGAARQSINERGIIPVPDLLVVADDSLVPMPEAGGMQGCCAATVVLLASDVSAQAWRQRLNYPGTLLTLPADRETTHFFSATCAAAAARLLGVISRAALQEALREEIGDPGDLDQVDRNLDQALAGYDAVAQHAGIVHEGGLFAAAGYQAKDWIDLPLDSANLAAAAIHAAATNVQVRTGLWRTLRPVLDLDRCHRCWWVCSAFCPDSAIHVNADQRPEIDYEHCKGCLICMAQCPSHAIRAIPEGDGEVSG